MVVDDEGVVLNSCQRVIESAGFEVSLITSAERALKTIEDEAPSLLLIDMKMPEQDGTYLLGEVKKRWPSISIIAMSGYYTLETIEEALKMGASSFIAKPFTPDELLKIVRQVIQKEKSHEREKGPRD